MNVWCILELMGHVRLAGYATEEKHFGAELGRIDVPVEIAGEEMTTVYFGGGSIYRLTPVSEEVARNVARHCDPRPVSAWEMRAPLQITGGGEIAIDVDNFLGHTHEIDEDDDTDHAEFVQQSEFASAAREMNETAEAPY